MPLWQQELFSLQGLHLDQNTPIDLTNIFLIILGFESQLDFHDYIANS